MFSFFFLLFEKKKKRQTCTIVVVERGSTTKSKSTLPPAEHYCTFTSATVVLGCLVGNMLSVTKFPIKFTKYEMCVVNGS